MSRQGLVYYAKGKADNYLSLSGTLNTWYTWAQAGMTLRLNDYILRSDASREPVYPGALPPIYGSGTIVDLTGQYLAGTQRQRGNLSSNVFSPSVEYEFTKDGADES